MAKKLTPDEQARIIALYDETDLRYTKIAQLVGRSSQVVSKVVEMLNADEIPVETLDIADAYRQQIKDGTFDMMPAYQKAQQAEHPEERKAVPSEVKEAILNELDRLYERLNDLKIDVEYYTDRIQILKEWLEANK